MTSTLLPDHTLAEPADQSTAGDISAAAADTTAEPASKKKPGIPAFTFPFSPAAFAPSKSDDQPWHQKGNKSAHEKRIGAAPNGTRRSMGKR
ncbi:hypothetical protein FBY03_101252 [Pseudomonas sp. SJZ079]|uniref:hypothetical protein n=1 Tax=Pseudomonas sp. SJZ079 TaxID=2572887 RepID=UPI00119A284C|nr:hypothetical protein [Pseudomonas sp. SJZ079]TWC43059.1 hypothetical protein FBY03_101252 [Pseudomonas sp. SJZ079]